jgi:porphobilinogen synthase
MPGVVRHRIPGLVAECRQLWKLGVPAVALFPKIEAKLKDADGTVALREDGLVLRAVRAIKAAVPEITVMTDLALDPYTNHGHDGVLTPDGRDVANDRTVAILARMAVLHARAGVDLVAPSDMMDGRVGAIRRSLDAAGFTQTGIMAYAAKFASAYYGPFRDAVGAAAAAGTRALSKATYQLNPANRREALIETALDEAEGADILMVKPAGPYLDIIRDVRDSTLKPVAAYQVSGEYAQLQAAARLGWLDLEKTRRESLLAIKRAGADMILTYFARAMAVELGP